MVEFALILPFFLALLFAVIGFGMAMNFTGDLNHIAAQGARKAAVTSDTNFDLAAYVKNAAEPGLVDKVVVTVCLPEGSDPGDPVMVKAEVKDHKIVQLIPIDADPLNVDLAGRATMRLERKVSLAGPVASTAASCT